MEYRLDTLAPLSLRAWRVDHNYTAAELAAILDVSENTINRWERGEREAPWRMLTLALHGLVFTHGSLCRCGNPRCGYRPSRYADNGRAYDPH